MRIELILQDNKCLKRYIQIFIAFSFILNTQMNPQEQQKINNSIIADLSSNQRYFYVFPFSKYQLINSELLKTKKSNTPIVLVYPNNDSLTVAYLIEKFFMENKLDNATKASGFQLKDNYVLDSSKTIAQIKGILRNEDIDGLQMFLHIQSELDANQCSYMDCLQSQCFFNKGDVQLACDIQPVGYTTYIKVRLDITVQSLQNLIAKDIQRIFGKQTKAQSMVMQVYAEKSWRLLKKNGISNLTKANKLRIYVKDVLLSLPIQNKCEIILKSSQAKTHPFDYNLKKTKKVRDLLQQLYPNQTKQFWENSGLFVDNQIIKNDETLQKIGHFFVKSTLSSKHFVAHIIKEYHIFELQQQKIQVKALKNPKYLKQIIVEEQYNLKVHKDCQRQIKNRANSASHAYFKGKIQHVQPILLYTSQLKVKPSLDKKNRKISSLYDTLNAFLRDQNFATIRQTQYQKWEFMFEAELFEKVNKLKHISPVTGTVLWRGVGYIPQYKIGQKIMFKQFLSTSKNINKAFEFAHKAIFKLKKSFSGSNIEEFSYFKVENQVLFPPYTEFKVTQIGKIKNILNNKQIPCFEVEQLQKQPIPTNKVRFILWVDDKTQEGKQIWAQFKHIEQTTMMIQLISNQQLTKWFQKNKHLVTDQTVEIVMICNMTRVQQGVKIEQAGIESIKIFRENLPNNSIFIYIGWLQGTLQKLNKHNYKPSKNLQVSNNQSQLKDFLNNKVSIK